jgi:hypothetical protein
LTDGTTHSGGKSDNSSYIEIFYFLKSIFGWSMKLKLKNAFVYFEGILFFCPLSFIIASLCVIIGISLLKTNWLKGKLFIWDFVPNVCQLSKTHNLSADGNIRSSFRVGLGLSQNFPGCRRSIAFEGSQNNNWAEERARLYKECFKPQKKVNLADFVKLT